MITSGKAALAVTSLFLATIAVAADPVPPSFELEPYFARYQLSGGRSDWTEHGMRLGLRTASRFAASAYVRETERFDLRDSEAGGSLYVPFGAGWAGSLEASASSTHRVLARHSVLAQLEKQFGQGWVARGALRRQEFDTGRADLRLVGIERYFGNERLAYTFYSGQAEQGGSAPAHRFDWSHYFGERASLGISYARGKEVENIPPDGILVTDVRAVALSASWWPSPRWGLSAVAETVDQGSLYRRRGVHAGLRYRF